MKKYIALIFIIFLFACSSSSDWILIGEFKLIKAERMRESFWENRHWLMTFESGAVIRNYDDACFIGEVYEIYRNEEGGYKAVLKVEKQLKNKK